MKKKNSNKLLATILLLLVCVGAFVLIGCNAGGSIGGGGQGTGGGTGGGTGTADGRGCYPNEHVFNTYVSNGDATCTEDGTKTAVCARCGETKTVTDVGSKLGHSYERRHEAKEPTCTELGWNNYTECKRCGFSTDKIVYPALGHDKISHESKSANCTEDGWDAYVTCTRCDYSTYKLIPATGHKEALIVDKEATCTTSGTGHLECEICKVFLQNKIIPILGHDYKNGICTRCDAEDIGYFNSTSGLEYRLIGESYACSGIGTANAADIVIASEYNGLPVTSIDDYAFQYWTRLTQVIIPDSITTIGRCAFSNCSGLTSVTIGNGVTLIGDWAFSDCSGLTSIEVDSGNTFYHSENDCLIETETKTLISGCQKSVIPSDGSVTTICGSAFIGCSGLTSIDIPDSVTSIGWSAFYKCIGLTSITIPNSVTSIGNSAFV